MGAAAVAERLRHIVAGLAPDTILVDQLAFSATAALRGLRQPFLSFLPGHPCQLPARGQTFGFPELRPPAIATSATALRSLRALCISVSTEFTAAYNASILALDPTAEPLADAFAAGGTLGTLVNYPAQVGAHSGRLPHATLPRLVHQVGGARHALREPRSKASCSAPSVRVARQLSLVAERRTPTDRPGDAVLGWDAVIATGATEPRSSAPCRPTGSWPSIFHR